VAQPGQLTWAPWTLSDLSISWQVVRLLAAGRSYTLPQGSCRNAWGLTPRSSLQPVTVGVNDTYTSLSGRLTVMWVLQCPEDEITGAQNGDLSENSPFPGHLPSSDSLAPFSAYDSPKHLPNRLLSLESLSQGLLRGSRGKTV